jgi:hypothetical protein
MKAIKALLATLLNQIRSLSSKLGEAPTLIYLLGYLIVIFVFSLIYYYALPGKHFYHSTAQYEYKFFNNDVKEILHDLRTEIRQLYQENGEAKQEINGWRMDTNNLETDSLNIENFPSEFSFQIIIPINNGTQGNWDSWTFLSAKVTVFTEEWISNNIVYSPFKIVNTTTTPVQGIPNRIPSPGIVYPYKVFDQQGAAPVLPLSQNLYNKITGAWQGVNGFPPKDGGQYLRMLYLSTGIATLSALGDIIPVSAQARLSVTLETIISVIFIGLVKYPLYIPVESRHA